LLRAHCRSDPFPKQKRDAPDGARLCRKAEINTEAQNTNCPDAGPFLRSPIKTNTHNARRLCFGIRRGVTTMAGLAVPSKAGGMAIGVCRACRGSWCVLLGARYRVAAGIVCAVLSLPCRKQTTAQNPSRSKPNADVRFFPSCTVRGSRGRNLFCVMSKIALRNRKKRCS
jgi:hypothetical protein